MLTINAAAIEETECSLSWLKVLTIAGICLVIKFLIAGIFPFTSDEAYLTPWGSHLAWGYYDHPPVLGWLLYLIRFLGRSVLLIRLVPVLNGVLIPLGLYAITRTYDQRKAYMLFLLAQLSPAGSSFFLMTTDAPLILFTFVSLIFLYLAEKSGSYVWYILSGVFLGIAFLSKYFAGLLGLSYFVYLLFTKRDRMRIIGYLLLFSAALPFVAQNMIWNWQMGWPNFMHNFFNRFNNDWTPVLNILSLTGILLYGITPPVLYFLFRKAGSIKEAVRNRRFGMFVWAAVLPLIVYFVVSLARPVRPHWYLAFLPYIFVLAVMILDNRQLRKCVAFSLVIWVSQAILILGAPLVPASFLKDILDNRDYASLVEHKYPDKVVAKLNQYSGRFVLAAKSYATAGLLGYYGNERVIVFGKGSRHGRNDDMVTNFKELKGANILVLEKADQFTAEDVACFERAELDEWVIEGAKYPVLFGYGFKYDEYRRIYLSLIERRYYNVPDWLPGKGNFFQRKYDFPVRPTQQARDKEAN